MYAFALCMPRPRIVDPPTSTNRWFTSSVDVEQICNSWDVESAMSSVSRPWLKQFLTCGKFWVACYPAYQSLCCCRSS